MKSQDQESLQSLSDAVQKLTFRVEKETEKNSELEERLKKT
jgi:hypothetical protein